MSFNFLDLFNAAAYASKDIPREYRPAESYDTPISEDDLNLDSLDVTLTFTLIGEMYGVPTELEDFWPVESIGALQVFVEQHKTKEPSEHYESIEAAVEEFK